MTESDVVQIRNETQPVEWQRIPPNTTPTHATLLLHLSLYCLLMNLGVLVLTLFWRRILHHCYLNRIRRRQKNEQTHPSLRNLLRVGRNEPRRNGCHTFKQSAVDCSINCGCCLYKTTCFCRRGLYSERELPTKTIMSLSKENETPTANTFPNRPESMLDGPPVSTVEGSDVNSVRVYRTDFDPSQLFLIQLLATFDMLTILAEYLIPAVVMFDNVQNSISYRTALNLGCRLTFMLLTFSKLITEWILVVYGIERILVMRRSCTTAASKGRVTDLVGQNNPYNRAALNTLKLKIGMSLFIALSFSGICNYIWMIGDVTPVKYQLENGSAIMQLELSCSLRQEYYRFYVHFLVYVEFLLLVLVPQMIHISSVLVIVFYLMKKMQHICKSRRTAGRMSSKSSTSRTKDVGDISTRSFSNESIHRSSKRDPVSPQIRIIWNGFDLSTTMFVANVTIRIGLSAGKNLDTFVAVFLKITSNKPFSHPCTALIWPVVSTLNITLLCLSLCILRRTKSEGRR
ncbi:hypothetical protein FGIG_02399 [Fasciola gigantica]|uniref:G-protein coupled receptors family 1 profile domain-containing protein n=1 Tax=Fasciola gigantica TaxID=46835 RepID=A0A504YCI1_FASGI|nr:hypothetical protein FGIG_02399 [Fasciola gigantica]